MYLTDGIGYGAALDPLTFYTHFYFSPALYRSAFFLAEQERDIQCDAGCIQLTQYLIYLHSLDTLDDFTSLHFSSLQLPSSLLMHCMDALHRIALHCIVLEREREES